MKRVCYIIHKYHHLISKGVLSYIRGLRVFITRDSSSPEKPIKKTNNKKVNNILYVGNHSDHSVDWLIDWTTDRPTDRINKVPADFVYAENCLFFLDIRTYILYTYLFPPHSNESNENMPPLPVYLSACLNDTNITTRTYTDTFLLRFYLEIFILYIMNKDLIR